MNEPFNADLFMSHNAIADFAHDFAAYVTVAHARYGANASWWINDQCRRFNTYSGVGIGVPTFPY